MATESADLRALAATLRTPSVIEALNDLADQLDAIDVEEAAKVTPLIMTNRNAVTYARAGGGPKPRPSASVKPIPGLETYYVPHGRTR